MNPDAEETEALLLELERDLEDPELNGELDAFIDEAGTGAESANEDLVFIVAHNGMSENMQEIDALYIIESEYHNRSVHIHATWEVKTPKEPKDITVEYLTDKEMFRKLRIEKARKFRSNLADGDYCKRDMDMGLVRLRGHQHLWQCAGVMEVINSTLGRNAAVIASFLEGNETYASDDLTYDNSWGSW